MADLIVNDEQARILSEAKGLILMRDLKGKIVGQAEPLELEKQFTSAFTDEEVAEAARRAKSSKTWHTTAEVLERLRNADH